MTDHLKELLCCYSEPLAVLGCFYKELVDFHARTKKNEKTACDPSRIETTCSPPQLTNVKPQPLGHTNNVMWASTIKQTRIHFCIFLYDSNFLLLIHWQKPYKVDLAVLLRAASGLFGSNFMLPAKIHSFTGLARG